MVDLLITIIRLIRTGRHSYVDVGVITRAFMLGDRVLLSEHWCVSDFVTIRLMINRLIFFVLL